MRHRAKQRYSWVGLVIALALVACVVMLVLDNPTEHYDKTATRQAEHDCLKKGLVAWTNHLHDTVTCVDVVR